MDFFNGGGGGGGEVRCSKVCDTCIILICPNEGLILTVYIITLD